MSGIANRNRRGRPSNPTIDDMEDPIIDRSEDMESASDLESGKSDEDMEVNNSVPSEIADMVQGLGIGGDYRVTLYKIPEGKRKSEMQATYQNRVPEVEEFASEFGGGDYILVFTWYQKDAKGANKVTRRVSISVGPHYNLIAKKKELEKRRDFQMDNPMVPFQGSKDENPLDMLIKYKSLMPKESNSMETMLPVIVSIMQQSNTQMMQMMQANMAMIVQMSQSKRSSIEELKELLEVKDMFGGKATSTTDLLITEGFSVLKEYAPVIKEAISKLNNPFTKAIAKKELLANPDIQAILADPDKKAAFIEHLYSQHPANEVDKALVNAGIITSEQTRS